jgi:hypothetical protein
MPNSEAADSPTGCSCQRSSCIFGRAAGGLLDTRFSQTMMHMVNTPPAGDAPWLWVCPQSCNRHSHSGFTPLSRELVGLATLAIILHHSGEATSVSYKRNNHTNMLLCTSALLQLYTHSCPAGVHTGHIRLGTEPWPSWVLLDLRGPSNTSGSLQQHQKQQTRQRH